MTGSGAVSRLLAVAFAAAVALAAARAAAAQAPIPPVITSPADGQVVQGLVEVDGVTDIPNFASAQLDFGYDPDPTGTWFTIQSGLQPVAGGLLATWDTTALSDGDYVLRLRVLLLDGSAQDALVKVRVRNYTAVPTPSPVVTPSATAALQIPTAMVVVPSETATAQPTSAVATPTALPPNPAGVSTAQIYARFWRGALVVGLLVLGFGVLLRLRR
jgi:hypothetical protein